MTRLAERPPERAGLRGPSPMLPVALVAATLATLVVFQTVQLTRDRATLTTIHANQEEPLREASRVRNIAMAIAGEAAQLADRGNKNAQAVQQQLRRAGIMIRPPAPAPALSR
ncbi:MAG TPA: hypothetical protein VGB90_07105 [Alphaproteobacteria bacterium]